MGFRKWFERVAVGALVGAFAAWFVGLCFLCWLAIPFGPGVAHSHNGDILITVGDRLRESPGLAFKLWAPLGAFLGAMIACWGGRWEALATFAAGALSGIFALCTGQFDGWLVLHVLFVTWLAPCVTLLVFGATRFLIAHFREPVVS